jgi:hypothetical protein
MKNCPGLNAARTLPDSLRYLDCSYNGYGLTPIPSLFFRPINALICGRSGGGIIGTLPSNLKYLSCHNLELGVLPSHYFSTLPSTLKYLSVATAIDSLPALPAGLECLDVSNNYFHYIPYISGKLKLFRCATPFPTRLIPLPPTIRYLDGSSNEFDTLD